MENLIVSTEIIIPQKLDEISKHQFSDRLFEITNDIFQGGTKEEFEDMVSLCHSDLSKFLIYKNAKNEWVGYWGLHRFTKLIDGKNVTVFRAQAGLKEVYRRKNASFMFPVMEILKYKIKHPYQEIYCFVAIISPTMYYLTDRYSPVVFPSYKRSVDAHVIHIIDACAKQFNFEKKEGDTFWARTVDWHTVYTDEEMCYWKQSNNKSINYYLELNPDFVKGKGLLTIIPISWKNIIVTFIRFFIYTFKKKRRK